MMYCWTCDIAALVPKFPEGPLDVHMKTSQHMCTERERERESGGEREREGERERGRGERSSTLDCA